MRFKHIAETYSLGHMDGLMHGLMHRQRHAKHIACSTYFVHREGLKILLFSALILLAFSP